MTLEEIETKIREMDGYLPIVVTRPGDSERVRLWLMSSFPRIQVRESSFIELEEGSVLLINSAHVS
jgi:hypothetical protein